MENGSFIIEPVSFIGIPQPTETGDTRSLTGITLQGADPKYGRFRQVALLTGIPLALMIGPICGYFAGNFIDQWLETDPWFMVLFVVIGGISGVREMLLLIKKAEKDG